MGAGVFMVATVLAQMMSKRAAPHVTAATCHTAQKKAMTTRQPPARTPRHLHHHHHPQARTTEVHAPAGTYAQFPAPLETHACAHARPHQQAQPWAPAHAASTVGWFQTEFTTAHHLGFVADVRCFWVAGSYLRRFLSCLAKAGVDDFGRHQGETLILWCVRSYTSCMIQEPRVGLPTMRVNIGQPLRVVLTTRRHSHKLTHCRT